MTIKIHIINLFLYFSIGYSLGCIQGDCYNGKGMIIYSNGEKYMIIKKLHDSNKFNLNHVNLITEIENYI